MGVRTASGTLPKMSEKEHRLAALHACEEEAYDDDRDHQRCGDCKGSGWYIGFTERKFCPTCDGSGFL